MPPVNTNQQSWGKSPKVRLLFVVFFLLHFKRCCTRHKLQQAEQTWLSDKSSLQDLTKTKNKTNPFLLYINNAGKVPKGRLPRWSWFDSAHGPFTALELVRFSPWFPSTMGIPIKKWLEAFSSLIIITLVSACVRACVRMCVCVCVCARARSRLYTLKIKL